MTQGSNRRGFITTAAGSGLFMAAGGLASEAQAAEIAKTDVLIAMPKGRYFALPRDVLERYGVSASEFAVEEKARHDRSAAGVSKDTDPPPPAPPPVAMGIRG